MSGIQAVTLDLWQTLVIDTREWGRIRTRIRIEDSVEALNNAGENVTEDQVREAFRAGYRKCRATREQGMEVTFPKQVRNFVEGISDGIMDRIDRETFAYILNRYSDAFYDSPPMIARGAPEALIELKQAGYRIGLISNTGMTPGRVFRAYLEEQGLVDFFDHMTFSDEVRMPKPFPAIFLHTFASMGCTPENTVHVGDHLRNDVVGASQVGMRTIWLRGFDDGAVEVEPTATIDSISELPSALQGLNHR